MDEFLIAAIAGVTGSVISTAIAWLIDRQADRPVISRLLDRYGNEDQVLAELEREYRTSDVRAEPEEIPA